MPKTYQLLPYAASEVTQALTLKGYLFAVLTKGRTRFITVFTAKAKAEVAHVLDVT